MKARFRSAAVATMVTAGIVAAPAIAFEIPDHPDSTNHPGTAHVPEGTPDQTNNPGSSNVPDTTPGPGASANAKRRAYGRHCADQSRKRVEGEKGTAFSRCVTAMAKLANGRVENPRTACKDLSRKHVKGEKGTPFSRCVKAGAQLLEDQAAQDPEATPTPAA